MVEFEKLLLYSPDQVLIFLVKNVFQKGTMFKWVYVSLSHEILSAFHLPRNSGWDVNGTHVFRALQWKVPGNKWDFENIVRLPVRYFPVEIARSI